MNLREAVAQKPFIFTEGAVLERVKRESGLDLDPYVLHAALVYSSEGSEALKVIYRQYIDITMSCGFPILLSTPTWRANPERLQASPCRGRDLNGDCFRFLEDIRREYGDYGNHIYIGGLIGCKGDAYKPEEALSCEEAYSFHKYQINALAGAGVDFLIAPTLPALSEALGISKVMAGTGKDYIISFVIRPEGVLLDGTTLSDAILAIDSSISPAPLFYMVNCVHPGVLEKALECSCNADEPVKGRLIGIQANTSSLSPEELDESAELHTEEPEVFAAMMRGLYLKHGIRVLGGCCGTDHRHIKCTIDEFLND